MSKEPKRNVYVGHRYVPKVMGEWDKTETYEGLSIVTNEGTSYTSKKRVPKGIDILNEEYWVVTGNYNAQIEEYRKDVREMEKEVGKKSDQSYVDNLNEQVTTELAQKVYHVSNINALKASDYKVGSVVKTLGYYTAGDGGGTFYQIKDTDLEADDGYVIQLENGLQAHLIHDGTVNVKWFGAKSDATYMSEEAGGTRWYTDKNKTVLATDNTPFFNKALRADEVFEDFNSTTLKMVVLIPSGEYVINGTVSVRKGQHLKGTGIGSTRILIPTDSTPFPTFALGKRLVNGEWEVDYAGIAPSISDMSTQGGSTQGAVIDGSDTAGISIFNVFITSAGIAINSPGGDLICYNVTIDMCDRGIRLGGSRNIFTGISFFFNNTAIVASRQCYDITISDSVFAYSKFYDINITKPETGNIKNLVISDCSFTGNGQYSTYVGSIVLNGAEETDIKINNCTFNNLPGFVVRTVNGALNNELTIDGIVVNGDKTNHEYIQGSTSKGIHVGNNRMNILNSTFKNIRGEHTILANTALGDLYMDGCIWKNIASDSFVTTSNSPKIKLVNNKGDNETPLINVSETARVTIDKNIDWLGGIQTGNGKKFVKIPTFNGNFNELIKVTANTNESGSGLYRKTGLYSVYRYTAYDDKVKDYVDSEVLSEAPSTAQVPKIEVEVLLDSEVGETVSENRSLGRYVVVSVPSSYTVFSIELI